VGFDITSPANERIKWLIRLRDRRHRDIEGLFVVEGSRLYQRAIEAGLSPVATFVSEPGLEAVGETVSVSPDVLDKASYQSRSQGLIAVFEQFDSPLDGLALRVDPLLLIAENVEKPGNLGAMSRTAAAAGADAVITIGDTVDRWNPNAVRSSTGAMFMVPIVATSWEVIDPWLARQGIELVAASPDADETLWDLDLTGPIAIVIGAEDVGLTPRAESTAHHLVAIPQGEKSVDSLNASVAAAVFLFETVRQRTTRDA
jgi:TrmH family RNA methyltransferase